jgi:hypothetical protein
MAAKRVTRSILHVVRAGLLYLVLVACPSLGCGCGGVALQAKAVQPRPGITAATARLFIRQTYLHVQERVILESSARLRPASSEIVEAEATFMHVWPDRVACDGWEATLVDGAGAPHKGESRGGRQQRIYIEGDRYLASAPAADGGRNEAHVAMCDWEFRAPELARSETLTLVLESRDETMRYTWRFAEGTPALSHHGPVRSREDAPFYDE